MSQSKLALGPFQFLATFAWSFLLVFAIAEASPAWSQDVPAVVSVSDTVQDTVDTAFAPEGERETSMPAARTEERRGVGIIVGRALDLVGTTSSASRENFGDNSRVSSFSDTPVILISASRVPLIMPMEAMRVTSGFGVRRAPMVGASRHHAGIDIGAPAGTPIIATGDATVTSAGRSRGYGLLVVLDHGEGLETRYAHMSRLAVATGDRVSAGQIIGFVGSTGTATGPHLHYETRENGEAVDPLSR